MTDPMRNPWEVERNRTLDTALHDFRDQPGFRSALALLSEGYTYHEDDMIGGATLQEVTAADRSPMATVVVLERETPYPPAYIAPLISNVPRQLLKDKAAVIQHVAQQRADDMGAGDVAGIFAGLEHCFAFAGEPPTIADWRG
jgi:hypothetical protein